MMVLKRALSRRFLAWLAEHPYTIAYPERDSLGRPGLVVVGTRRIDVEVLRAQGAIASIEAIPSYVWWHGPSFDPTPTEEDQSSQGMQDA